MLATITPGEELMNAFETDRDAGAMGSDDEGDVDNAPVEDVNARTRLELLEVLADPLRVDFDVVDLAWGGSA